MGQRINRRHLTAVCFTAPVNCDIYTLTTPSGAFFYKTEEMPNYNLNVLSYKSLTLPVKGSLLGSDEKPRFFFDDANTKSSFWTDARRFLFSVNKLCFFTHDKNNHLFSAKNISRVVITASCSSFFSTWALLCSRHIIPDRWIIGQFCSMFWVLYVKLDSLSLCYRYRHFDMRSPLFC